VHDHTLNVSLARTPEEAALTIGPLRWGFRYAFGSLLRCIYRWHRPEMSWWDLPYGMARPLVPPQQFLHLGSGADLCLDALRKLLILGCPETLESLVGWTTGTDAESPEGMFWIADADALRKHVAKMQDSLPPIDQGTLARKTTRSENTVDREAEAAVPWLTWF